ncbi:hypothetical protein LXL04_036291 [Taraxacum kok-saghyz]
MEEPKYDSDDYEEEELDTELIDVTLEEDFKPKGMDRCMDSFLNISSDVEDNELEDEEDDNNTDAEREEFGSEEEIDDAAGANETNLGDAIGMEYPIHNPSVKWNKMKPIVGERYESPQQLKQCLLNYAIRSAYSIKFAKCDSVRLHALCGSRDKKVKCPFRVYASWMTQERSFQIKTLVDEHKCMRDYKVSNLMHPTWLARHFVKELMMKPTLKCKELQAIVKAKFHCGVSWSKAYRARCRADHYGLVWDYAQELSRSNPGSTIKVGVSVNPKGVSYFQRMYVCFKAIKHGWMIGCRRVIGLDGSFLKGPCQGELLIAIGRDPNNQVFPIAWAVVEVENKDNWRWFLNLLSDDLRLQRGGELTVISDQHKGLLEATKEILPSVEHRKCARHIYANFSKFYSGLELKNMFWAAAFSTVEGEFERIMDEINQVNPDAYKHLIVRHPKTWCRAYFNCGVACEAVENGIAECFNAIILDARKKPLIAMLEDIRLYMMDRFYHMLQKAEKWDGINCLAAIKKMHKFGEDLRNWHVNPSGPSVFEARNRYQGYAVNLDRKECNCRLWEISGIPCVHAQAALLFTGQDPATFISRWFSVQNFKASYATNILPVNGSNLWARTAHTKPLPPLARRMTGRPTVKRKRHVTESQDKYSQKKGTVSGRGGPIGRTVQCRNCLQRGHNKVSCKNPMVTQEPKPKKKMGRPRVNPDVSHWTRGGSRGGVRGSGGSGRGGSGGSGRGGSGESSRGGSGGSGKKVQDAGMGLRYEPLNEQDFINLLDTLGDLEQSGYTTAEIQASLGLANEEMEQLIHYKDTVYYHLQFCIDVITKELEDPHNTDAEFETQEEGIPETQADEEGIPETQAEEEGIPETQPPVEERKQKQKLVVRRKPSERIINRKLGTQVGGIGSKANAALELE